MDILVFTFLFSEIKMSVIAWILLLKIRKWQQPTYANIPIFEHLEQIEYF